MITVLLKKKKSSCKKDSTLVFIDRISRCLGFALKYFRKTRGAWMAQSAKRPTSAQVMISWPMSSSPASGSVLTAQSLEPASDSVSLSLSAPPPLTLCISKKQTNKQTKNQENKKTRRELKQVLQMLKC